MPPPDSAQAKIARELVRRVASGDRSAEAELVERYGERLAFLLRRWTRDDNTARELYQETFRQALEKLRADELRQAERLPSYLVGLAKNLARYHYRKSDRRAAYHDEPGETVQFADPSPGLLARLLDKEKAALVRRVLHELPTERDREVLSRVYRAEDDSKTICADLGLAASHFKRVLYRARERYRALFIKRVGASDTTGGTA